ncbi:phage baseplate plug family protein [Burkholderia plantarii]|uniref:Cyanophage baseplate Pam3 plug gp18 domain-containing protein n=1 Tax=Burkholderia plantarii TaxID=41899 RepID=A0A0B6RLW1_BURPL|nr:hypothetical protein [Burkholderia plantarii]AJK46297.1 hypothetical protein BGL_1c17880 [Burkholderia plantarii]
MTTFYEIPLAPTPQVFSITLSGVAYRLTVLYRDAAEAGWTLDMAHASGDPLINGIPLVTGVDLLGQYRHLGLGGRLWVQGDDGPDELPSFDDLGVGSHVFWATDS